MNPEVDTFLNGAGQWQEEMEQLRSICLECGLTEALKWKKPCYSFQGSNIAIIQPFKESCALMFFKGVLLDDPHGILEKPGANSRISRRISFTDVEGIVEQEVMIKEYILKAIEAEKVGKEVKVEKKNEPFPDELQQKFDESPALENAFNTLTLGRQRGYILHFSDAKQAETRRRRIEKYIPRILNGKGINDR